MTARVTEKDDEPRGDEASPTSNPPAAPTPPTAERTRRVAQNAARVVLGLGLGLAITEAVFWFRDGGAFPHVNVYVEDAERGVRLRPFATEKIRFSKNPITHLRINSEGYRGGEYPPASPSVEEVIVVGDSQVLGLGVEENETFSAALQRSLGERTLVRNLGVPTYGPPEYNAVVAEALAKRPAKTVVYVVNIANDLFEATRKNKDRHAVWDGWAVRKETAPASTTKFPGRGLIYTESHAVFALRGYFYDRSAKVGAQGFASEGGWQDIGDAAKSAHDDRTAAEAEQARLAAMRDAQIKYAEDHANMAAKSLDSKVIGDAPYDELRDEHFDWDNPSFVPKEALFEASRLSPGDIVAAQNGESSRDVKVNAEHIRRGALIRLAIEKKARERAMKKNDKEILDAFAKRDDAEKKAAELRSTLPPKLVPFSPLTPALRDVKATCDKYKARLVVVALPVDVQVSKEEWKKYGVAPVDMEPTKILNEDVVVAARAMGAEGLDAFNALSEAEPGAFLDGDLHMTPKGHKAVGEAIAKVLAAPRLAIPSEGIPGDRSWLPRPEEWAPNTEINVRESDPAACETKRLREWLGVFCRAKGGAKGVLVSSGTEVLAGALPGEAILIAPVIQGQDLKATFNTADGATRDFIVKVTEPENPEIGFTKPIPARADIPGPSPEAGAFCACFKQQNPGKECSQSTILPNADCTRTYGGDCARVLACSNGDPKALPECPPGQARAGAAQRCMPLCSTDPSLNLPCKSGKCTAWRGGQVCM